MGGDLIEVNMIAAEIPLHSSAPSKLRSLCKLLAKRSFPTAWFAPKATGARAARE
jgi:hypothetical protein